MGWTYIQFRLANPRWSMKYVDLKRFIQVAANRGLLKRSWYQLTTSFGYEVWNGGIGNTVNHFRTMIQAR